ncbi:MAG TPA: hypothetical protein DEQ47_16650 [Solibacterales bacterium]|nr:hypothetical protein [Bryobacterales bacterium]
MWQKAAVGTLALWCSALGCGGATLTALPEHLRPDPFGGIVAADRVAGAAPARELTLEAARGGYASCHLLVSLSETGPYRLAWKTLPAATGVEVKLFREWFHFLPASNSYYPDALIPIQAPYAARLPDAENRIPKQTTQSFWVDVWVPPSAAPGEYKMTAALEANGTVVTLPLQLQVLPAIVPAEDPVAIDHNSYGTSWLATEYPRLRSRMGAGFFESPRMFQLIHAYHRIFYEHRGIFHQLGYGHAGKVGPEFAPRLAGSGKHKHVADWALYDQHYGPLLDGSAFAKTHRGAKPIPFVYLPINPEWPASFEWWGEPGYEREFVNVVSEMERHFREKGWTATRFEMFFNHKKRYKGFAWDGDETRFVKDYAYFPEYARLLKLAVPADSPVKFVFRADVSWTMERQWRELKGIVNFWVCGGGMFRWYPYAPKMLKDRGDIVWTYGGTPPVTEPSSHITIEVLRAWMQGVQGFTRWQTTAAGADPWFQFNGGAETLIYPGDRFGLAEPLPSIRLKLERNAVQDLALLGSFAGRQDANRLRAGAAKAFNDTLPAEWWAPRPPLADGNPEDWSNADIEDASPVTPKFGKLLDAAAWQRVRRYVFDLAREAH